MDPPSARDYPAAFVNSFFDEATATFTHVLYDLDARQCAVVDPVLDFDSKAARTARRSADRVADFVKSNGLTVQWLLETHAHADHISAASYLKELLGGVIAVGQEICSVQRTFKEVFNLDEDVAVDGSQFGHLFAPDEVFMVGGLRVRAMHVPGHTQADVAYVVEDAQGEPEMVFVGDTLFMPDVGSARCDFPGGDARSLYQSVQRLLALPASTRLFMCHDYPPAGRGPSAETTVGEQLAHNVHLKAGVDEAAFVEMRQKRDATLGWPALILPAIQLNIRAGELPPAEDNGRRYLKIPLDTIF